jgi:hypothetical protein
MNSVDIYTLFYFQEERQSKVDAFAVMRQAGER